MSSAAPSSPRTRDTAQAQEEPGGVPAKNNEKSDAPDDRRGDGDASTTKTTYTVALVGRPNSGKSSLYNAITGGHARVGNYPGITVDVLEAEVRLPSGLNATIADLPGLYSIEATVSKDTDEGIARTFLDELRASHHHHHPSHDHHDEDASTASSPARGRVRVHAHGERHQCLVVQVIDPTRLALGLRLTRELAKCKLPLLLALTHKDVLHNEGREVDTSRLSDTLNVPVVLVDARDANAKATLLAAIDDQLRDHEPQTPEKSFDPSVVARDVMRDIATSDQLAKRRRKLTERLDAVLLHSVIGPFLFIAVMALLFAAVFLVADPVSGAFDKLLSLSRGWINGVLGKGLLASFVTDGLLGGAGTVLAFMPQIVILTIALEVLEASGYLARGAFLLDRLLRVLGLSGRSFLPLLMGHACAVPALAATRVVRDPRERLTTILVLPLMTCSARLPTYALVLATFFSGRSALFRACLFVGLYFSGIIAALIASSILRRTATRGKSLPLVLEMPSYRIPQPSVVARKAYQSSRRFLRDVGTTIVIASAVLWVLLSIPMPGSAAGSAAAQSSSSSTSATRSTAATAPTHIESSIAATIGRAIEPVTKPAGFDWKINVGLIGSFGARELMVATMGVVYGVEGAPDDAAPLAQKLREAKRTDGSPTYGIRTGLALLAFFVLACQCMSTIAAIRRETSTWRWPAFVLAYTYAVGYVAAVLVYQIGGVLGVP